jgi:hypothetical protein
VSLESLVNEAKAKLEQFLGGPALAQVKDVVDDLKTRLAAAEVVVEADEEKLEAQADKLEAAVKAQVDVELKKLEAYEPEIQAAAKAALEAVVEAFLAAK